MDGDRNDRLSFHGNQKLALLATGGGIAVVCLAAVLTLVVGARERHCKPLHLEFEIVSQTNPESGEDWDRGSGEQTSPDPMGWVKVTTDGKNYNESISQRRDRYKFQGDFFAKGGVPLSGNSTIEVTMVDRDRVGAQGVGEINHSVWLAGGGSATSENGALEMSYTCRSE